MRSETVLLCCYAYDADTDCDQPAVRRFRFGERTLVTCAAHAQQMWKSIEAYPADYYVEEPIHWLADAMVGA